ncbi:MAG TPA: hypothetical protein VJX92_06035 [Methylomirabilota bacterium]|nr:hypothetical protein [Methylomirabilota bacterium]
MRRILPLAATLLTVLLAACDPALAQEQTVPASTAATLTVLSGRVEHAHAGASRAVTATSGTDLAVGDRVLTGPKGRALITFLDGSTVSVEPASDVTVRQAEMDGRDASRVRLLVTIGTVWARVAGWLGGQATVTIQSNTYSATAHDGLIGAQQQREGPFVCWTRAGAVDVADSSGTVLTKLQPGQKATLAPGRPPVTEGFSVNQSVLEVAVSGPVQPLVVMPDERLAGFVRQGIEVNQVFGSLTVAREDGSRIVEVPAGLSGPFILLVTPVSDGPYTVTVVGRYRGAVVYRHERSGVGRRGQQLRADVIQTMAEPSSTDPRTARVTGAGVSALRPEVARPGLVVLSPLELAAPRP